MTDQEIFAAVTAWFRNDEWEFSPDEDELIVRSGITGKNGKFRLYSRVTNGTVIVHTVPTTEVPAEKRSAVAEFITRANYGLLVGNFEMDFGDGEVRYKTSLSCPEDGDLTPGMIKSLVYVNCMMMDRYYPGLMTVTYGGETPQQAVQRIEWTHESRSGEMEQ